MSIVRRSSAPSWAETVVKAGLSAVPVVGGPLATLVDDIAARHRDRVTEFADAAIEGVGGPEEMMEALRKSERVADMFFEAAVASSATAHAQKRKAMAAVVAQAATDDARVDESQLLMDALVDLDAPQFAVLGQIDGVGDDEDEVRRLADAAPEPVVAGLNRHGLLTQVGTYGGGYAVTSISRFGRDLLAYLREDGA
jgi:uncharacterized protein related to proFAR isomerase